MKKILSIDGGGMKGIVSAVVLRDLERKLREYSKNPDARLADYMDLIAGTSTGAILTGLYLFANDHGGSKFSAEEVLQLYIDQGEYIFKRRFGYPFVGAKYTNRRLKQRLYEYFGDACIADLRRPCLMVAYDMTKKQAVFFNTVSSRKDEKRNYSLVDAIMASTAAPTYFPPQPLTIGKKRVNCLVDGGVVANNPAMTALIESLKLPGNNKIEDTLLLSVGNLTNKKSYCYDEVKRWGLISWAVPMFDVLLNGNEQTVDYELRKIYQAIDKPHNYYRMIWVTEEEIPGMDDTGADDIKKLIEYGEKLAYREKYRIEEIARKITEDKVPL